MKIAGEFVFDGSREEVWDLVRDPEVLAAALPGTQSLNKISESEYEGKMQLRVGPVSGVFSGKVVVSGEVPPRATPYRSRAGVPQALPRELATCN